METTPQIEVQNANENPQKPKISFKWQDLSPARKYIRVVGGAIILVLLVGIGITRGMMWREWNNINKATNQVQQDIMTLQEKRMALDPLNALPQIPGSFAFAPCSPLWMYIDGVQSKNDIPMPIGYHAEYTYSEEEDTTGDPMGVQEYEKQLENSGWAPELRIQGESVIGLTADMPGSIYSYLKADDKSIRMITFIYRYNYDNQEKCSYYQGAEENCNPGRKTDKYDICISEIIPLDELGLTDTSDWKTYRNEEYGFEIKMPSDLYERMSVTKTEIWDEGVPGDDISLNFIVQLDDTVDWVDSKYEALNINIYPRAWWDANVVTEEEAPASAWYKTDNPNSPDWTPSIGLYLNKNSKYAFVGTRGQECPGNKKDPKQTTVECQWYCNDYKIYSTFKFTDPSTSSGQAKTGASEWKTYRNEEYGFEIKYPKSPSEMYVNPAPGGERFSIPTKEGDSSGLILTIRVESDDFCPKWSSYYDNPNTNPCMNVGKPLASSNKAGYKIYLYCHGAGRPMYFSPEREKDIELCDRISEGFEVFPEKKIENWKRYSNTKYGIDFMYPSYLCLKEGKEEALSGSSGIGLFKGDCPSGEYNPYSSRRYLLPSGPEFIGISIINNQLSLKEQIHPSDPHESTTIAGTEGYYLPSSMYMGRTGPVSYTNRWMFKSSTGYTIFLEDKPGITREILSTLKYIK